MKEVNKEDVLSLMERIGEDIGDILEEGKRADFLSKVNESMPALISHWCLVHYCTLRNILLNKLHWQKELVTFMLNICDLKLENNKYSYRYKTLFDLIKKFNYNKPDFIFNKIKGKLLSERKLGLSTKDINILIFDFTNSLMKIIDLLSKSNKDEIKRYVYEEV